MFASVCDAAVDGSESSAKESWGARCTEDRGNSLAWSGMGIYRCGDERRLLHVTRQTIPQWSKLATARATGPISFERCRPPLQAAAISPSGAVPTGREQMCVSDRALRRRVLPVSWKIRQGPRQSAGEEVRVTVDCDRLEYVGQDVLAGDTAAPPATGWRKIPQGSRFAIDLRYRNDFRGGEGMGVSLRVRLGQYECHPCCGSGRRRCGTVAFTEGPTVAGRGMVLHRASLQGS